MWFINILLANILLGIFPIMLGDGLWNEIREERMDLLTEIFGRYLLGTIIMWAVFQAIAVPMILVKGSFSHVVVIWEFSMFAILLLQSAYRIKRKQHIYHPKSSVHRYRKKHPKDKMELFCFLFMCVIVMYQCISCIVGTQYDEDDARFVVNSLEAFDHDSMLLINPATGEYVGTWVGELAKEVASPWTIYIALLAKILNVHPTIVAHTVLPGILVAMAYGVYWLIAGRIYKKNFTDRCLFVIVAAIVNLFFTNSDQTQAVFLLTRVWQGKAVVAGVMIPFLCYLMMLLYQKYKEKQMYVIVFLTDIACCLLSGMGIFFSGVLLGTFGLYIAIAKKDVRILLRFGAACIPAIVFGIIYIII
ncbi:DUF6077 domain-containing protein [Lachnospiraceae bacterium SGI.085]